VEERLTKRPMHNDGITKILSIQCMLSRMPPKAFSQSGNPWKGGDKKISRRMASTTEPSKNIERKSFQRQPRCSKRKIHAFVENDHT